jgi:hypothetical protein
LGQAPSVLTDGRYDIALTIEGRKLYADGRGKEREARLDGRSTSASSAPSRARSVDPYNKRIDRNSDDNLARVVR